MRTLLLALLIALAIPADARLHPALALELQAGERQPLPELRFSDLSGNPAKLADFKGKVVVLNLWATWCFPCREEMPGLDRLQAMFPKGDVLVIALSLDRGGDEKVVKFIDEIGAKNLAVYRDAKAEAARTLKIPGLPATILVDREGREAVRKLGIETWDGPTAVAAVKALVAEPPG